MSKMQNTALLVLDVQVGNTSRIGLRPTYFPLLSKTITEARSHMKVIYVTTAFRPGYPEIASSNPTFSAATKSNVFIIGAPDTLIDPHVAPTEGDIVVEKKRVSAFSGSGLDFILRGLEIKTLVLAGISTSGVVLSTVCDAADRDFQIVVLEDLCLDLDDSVHGMLMGKYFTKRGEVVGAEKWLERLKA